MDQLLSRLLDAVPKIRTPLVLAGVVMLVLYAILSQILHLDIFANVGSSGTIQLIGGLIQKLFILAITSLVLGVLSYLATLYFRHRSKRSKLELIDSRLDPDSSNYVVAEKKNSSDVIRRRERDQK